ncbi:DUF1499 domain-containing protein [Mesorhizobium sp. CAU 1732]|uniref:DUF1499 domain-containing protein n=1 Tax=Mesorhizobium sp. CAU 1732 TaxID=3140358 RepID=UPI0032616211
MVVLPERRVSPYAQWARSVARFSLVLFLLAGVAHRYGLLDTIGFFWIIGLVALLAVVGLALAAIGFRRLWSRGEKAGRASLAATVLAGIVLAPFALSGYFAVRYPMLHDISTDLLEPPAFTLATPARTELMNPIGEISREDAEIQMRAYPDIAGRRIAGSMERVLSALSAVVASRGWLPARPIAASSLTREISIEMQAPTFLLRYPVDAVVRLSDEGESVFVDMRMNSRYGRHDLGDGARRIRAFMSDLVAEFDRQSLEIIDIPALPEAENPVQ